MRKGEGAPVVPFPRRAGSAEPSPAPPLRESAAEALERRLRRVTRTILAVGFGGALVAWIVARARPENPLGYDPLDNKKYVHDLQVYGGTANVVAAEFREWFAGLWYGKNLAYTIAVLTVLVVLLVRFYLLTNPSVDEEGGGAREDAS
jgi:multisubunit Na+/H+ antiporter MnhB subunit